jgi:hypothetical protein
MKFNLPTLAGGSAIRGRPRPVIAIKKAKAYMGKRSPFIESSDCESLRYEDIEPSIHLSQPK